MSEEVQRRVKAYLTECALHDAWDSEFTMSPHSPGAAMDALVALGEEAVDPICSLALGPEGTSATWAVWGLRDLGPTFAHRTVPVLEQLISRGGRVGPAVECLASLDPERFWAEGSYRHTQATGSLAAQHQKALTAGPFFERLLATGHEKALLEALRALRPIRGEEPGLVIALRRIAASSLSEARSLAAHVVSSVPGAGPVEALIESAVLSKSVSMTLVERVATHPESQLLLGPLVQLEATAVLANLLRRRRCAGLETAADGLLPLVERKLRHPKREWRFEQHDVHEAAECALELEDVALLPALVDAVIPANTGYAWEPLREALRFFGPLAIEALSGRSASGPEPVRWMLDQLARPGWGTVENADREFRDGSIDHTTGGAFSTYARALQAGGGAHAAFQLAWIDRAFGVAISTDRARWIASLGFHDQALLEELLAPVKHPLVGARFEWRGCSALDAPHVADAGLPGLAFQGSRAPEHRARAEAHLQRVRDAVR